MLEENDDFLMIFDFFWALFYSKNSLNFIMLCVKKSVRQAL